MHHAIKRTGLEEKKRYPEGNQEWLTKRAGTAREAAAGTYGTGWYDFPEAMIIRTLTDGRWRKGAYRFRL